MKSKHVAIRIKREIWSLPCAICGRPDDIEVDHIKSVKNGGSKRRSNLQALCRVCNAIKRDKKTNLDVAEWIQLHPDLFKHKQKMRTSRLEDIAKFGRGGWF